MNESNQSISILMAIYWPFLVRAFSVGFVRRIASFGTDFAFTCFLVAFLQRLTNARWYISPIYFSESRHADGIFTSKYTVKIRTRLVENYMLVIYSKRDRARYDIFFIKSLVTRGIVYYRIYTIVCTSF